MLLEDYSVRYKRGREVVGGGSLKEDFATWLRSKDARPFFYHRGNLAVDRLTDAPLDVVAKAAMIAQDRGLVDLVQRRVVGPDGPEYNYIAVKRRRV